MGQRMTWEEMKTAYPDEWIAIIDEDGDVDAPYGDITGTVLTHHSDKWAFTSELKPLMKSDLLVDIRYTGELLPDNPVGPMLWHIPHIDS